MTGGPAVPVLYTKAPSKSYTFVETHQLYVKDLRDIPENLPPPRSPARQKSEIFDVTNYKTVDEKAIRVG